MYSNQISDEISSHLLTANFNARAFLMFHRRLNERNQEMPMMTNINSMKYSTFIQPRGFARLTNLTILSDMLTDDGMNILDEFSRELLDDYLILFQHHWQRSNTNFANKIEYIQSEFHRQTRICLKKSLNEYEKVLSHWISKNRLR